MKIESEVLKRLYVDERKKQIEIAEMYGMTKPQIYSLLRKYKIKRDKGSNKNIPLENHRKAWNDEQDEYLIENFGRKSLELISKKLQRKPIGVRKRARQLKLGDIRSQDDFITKSYLTSSLHIDHRTVEKWGELGLKITKRSVTDKQKINQIKLSDFWKWAEKNKELIRWNKFEQGILGVEPQWTMKARLEHKENNPSKLGIWWTNEEDKILESSYKAGIPIKSIADNLGRSRGSTDRRIQIIMLERRGYNAWNDEQIKELKEFVKQKLTTKQIAEKMDKDFMCIKGARERYISKPKKQIQA